MKKICAVLALVAIATGVNAQEKSKSNAIKANLFSPLVKSGSFFYERKINQKSSAQLGFGFTSFTPDDLKIKGIFITPEYRFYPSANREAMNGFYVGPYLRYQNLKLEENFDNEVNKATLSTFGGGVLVGRQWIFGDIVTLDIFLGPSYNSGKVKIKSGDEITDIPGTFEGFGLRTGLTVGLAF